MLGMTVFAAADKPPVEEIADYHPDLNSSLNGEIVVNGEIIEAPAPYYSAGSDGIIMLPLRAIAEILGFEVVWNSEDQGIRIGKAIDLWIGKDYYTVGRRAPITGLGAAPELTGGSTYVPIAFFREVLPVFDVKKVDCQIIIETAPAND